MDGQPMLSWLCHMSLSVKLFFPPSNVPSHANCKDDECVVSRVLSVSMAVNAGNTAIRDWDDIQGCMVLRVEHTNTGK